MGSPVHREGHEHRAARLLPGQFPFLRRPRNRNRQRQRHRRRPGRIRNAAYLRLRNCLTGTNYTPRDRLLPRQRCARRHWQQACGTHHLQARRAGLPHDGDLAPPSALVASLPADQKPGNPTRGTRQAHPDVTGQLDWSAGGPASITDRPEIGTHATTHPPSLPPTADKLGATVCVPLPPPTAPTPPPGGLATDRWWR